MIKKVEQYSISDIFKIGSDTVYRIPIYQREYKWGTKSWQLLFDDVVENGEGYFIGSYICVSDSSMGGSTLELIDGQQRFTSLSLLLLALYSELTILKNDNQLDQDELMDYNNIRFQLSYRKQTSKSGKKTYDYFPKLILQGQNYNDDDYKSLLYENGIIGFAEKPLYRGVRRPEKAYEFFKKLIKEYVSDKLGEDPDLEEKDVLFELVNLFNACVIVGIEVDSHKDAYMLFESLNNRGEPLSAIDLIKNMLISRTKSVNEANECYSKWEAAIKNVSDDYSVQERFFRQYYNAFRQELNEPFKNKKNTKTYPLGYLATKSTVLEIYEKLINADYIKFVDDFVEYSSLYSIIIDNSDIRKKYKGSLQDLGRIQGAPSYLLLLYLLKNQEAMELSDSDIDTVVQILIKFFVRRNITDFPNTRNLTKIFMDIVDNIRDLYSSDVIDAILNKLKKESAPEITFDRKLRGPVYDENDTATRFILCSIEAKHQTKEIYSDFWIRENNRYTWTIEHIFPEGENIPKDWVNMIADGDKAKAEEYLEKYVHTLGNLTLTGYNQNLSNMSFEKKKNRKSKDGKKEVGYKNGLFLNKDVVSQQEWKIKNITDRTEKLVKLVKQIFAW